MKYWFTDIDNRRNSLIIVCRTDVHFTTAIDTLLVRVVMAAISDHILARYAHRGFLYCESNLTLAPALGI